MRHPHVVTWPEVVFDKHGTSDLPSQPLTYRRSRCTDCDWKVTTRTYTEAVDLSTEHELLSRLAVQHADLAAAAA